jgi:O-antigen/teichoic acid export membrane protein
MNRTALLELLHQKALRTGIGERTKSLLRGLSWTMPSAMFSRVACGLTTVLAARTMGPAEFGLSSLALATTLWVQVPLFLGIPTAIMHFVPRVTPDEKPLWIFQGMRLVFLCGGLTLLVAFSFSPSWSSMLGVGVNEFNAGLLWCLGCFFFVGATTVFNAQERFKARAISEVVFASLFPVIVAW